MIFIEHVVEVFFTIFGLISSRSKTSFSWQKIGGFLRQRPNHQIPLQYLFRPLFQSHHRSAYGHGLPDIYRNKGDTNSWFANADPLRSGLR